jgi:hypothetical protein
VVLVLGSIQACTIEDECGIDQDCKGQRVCVQGVCEDPGGSGDESGQRTRPTAPLSRCADASTAPPSIVRTRQRPTLVSRLWTPAVAFHPHNPRVRTPDETGRSNHRTRLPTLDRPTIHRIRLSLSENCVRAMTSVPVGLGLSSVISATARPRVPIGVSARTWEALPNAARPVTVQRCASRRVT